MEYRIDLDELISMIERRRKDVIAGEILYDEAEYLGYLIYRLKREREKQTIRHKDIWSLM